MIIESSGVIIFVESNRPPNPVSITAKSTFSSEKNSNDQKNDSNNPGVSANAVNNNNNNSDQNHIHNNNIGNNEEVEKKLKESSSKSDKNNQGVSLVSYNNPVVERNLLNSKTITSDKVSNSVKAEKLFVLGSWFYE